ncbi:hypothetical protein ACRAKI_10885 [Saccharothrix isguenensis]
MIEGPWVIEGGGWWVVEGPWVIEGGGWWVVEGGVVEGGVVDGGRCGAWLCIGGRGAASLYSGNEIVLPKVPLAAKLNRVMSRRPQELR